MRSARALRAHLLLRPLSGALVGIAATFGIVAGCAGDPLPSEPEEDAGRRTPDDEATDARREPPREAAPEDAATCDLALDFTAAIQDGAIADGQSTTGHCLGCAKTSCAMPIEACNGSCACKTAAAEAFECFARTSGGRACADAFAGDVDAAPLGREVLGCSTSKCAEPCQVDPFKDAG